MNYIYIGKPADVNIGNGKTSSAVKNIIESATDSSTIFSNIKLMFPYEKITPDNLSEVLETENAIVLFDELHAMVHKNHRVDERCKAHNVIGLCYFLSEFFRQVRKREIDTHITCQTFEDCQFQYRQLMNFQIVCEKYYLDTSVLRKCKNHKDKECRAEQHKHFIKQTILPEYKIEYQDISQVITLYDSYEIVKGWVCTS